MSSASEEEKEIIVEEKINIIVYEGELVRGRERERLRISCGEKKSVDENIINSMEDDIEDERRKLLTENDSNCKEYKMKNENNNENRNDNDYENNYEINIEKEKIIKDIKNRKEWDDKDINSKKQVSSSSSSSSSSVSVSVESSTLSSSKNCFFDISKIKQKIQARNSKRKNNSKENENNEIMMETFIRSSSNEIMKSVGQNRIDILENEKDDFNDTGTFHFDENFENGNPECNFRIFQRERKLSLDDGCDLYDENNFENITFKPWKVRISRAAVSSSTYVRARNNKRKKRSISYFLIKGPTLQTVPEKVEMTKFNEPTSVGKSKKCNHSHNGEFS